MRGRRRRDATFQTGASPKTVPHQPAIRCGSVATSCCDTCSLFAPHQTRIPPQKKMIFYYAWMVLLACFCLTNQRSFVQPAPTPNGAAQDAGADAQDSSVKELENLKHSLGKTVAFMKSQAGVYQESHGQKEGHQETHQELKENGKLVARLDQKLDVPGKAHATLEIPSEGIHKSVTEELQGFTADRRSPAQTANQQVDNTLSGGSVQYSPLDMAEYVFWTGDEKGVTLAIEEFLQEGLMTREEAISFLQEIKYNLEYLKGHYTQLGLNSATSRGGDHSKQTAGKVEEVKKRTVEEKPLKTDGKIGDEDYDELLERLRVADFLYTEYSLEEVIYQLAKVMFTQSLTRGSAEAQQALQKFTNFLEMEAEQGHISRALEKKVLDVLIASLSDTLSEHPELLATARESLEGPASNDNQHFIRQILDMNPSEEKMPQGPNFFAYKTNNNNKENLQHLKDNKLSHIPLGLGKYKNP